MNTFEVTECVTLNVQTGEQEGKHECIFNSILKMLNTNMLVVSDVWSLLYIVLHYDYPANFHLKCPYYAFSNITFHAVCHVTVCEHKLSAKL